MKLIKPWNIFLLLGVAVLVINKFIPYEYTIIKGILLLLGISLIIIGGISLYRNRDQF